MREGTLLETTPANLQLSHQSYTITCFLELSIHEQGIIDYTEAETRQLSFLDVCESKDLQTVYKYKQSIIPWKKQISF